MAKTPPSSWNLSNMGFRRDLILERILPRLAKLADRAIDQRYRIVIDSQLLLHCNADPHGLDTVIAGNLLDRLRRSRGNQNPGGPLMKQRDGQAWIRNLNRGSQASRTTLRQ